MNAKPVNNNFEKVLLNTKRRFDTPPEEEPIDLDLIWDGLKYIVKYTNEEKKNYSFTYDTFQEAFNAYKELCTRVVSDDELSGTES